MLDLLITWRALVRRGHVRRGQPRAVCVAVAVLLLAVLVLAAPGLARAQSGSPSTLPADPGPAPATAPAPSSGGGFFARLARGLDQANAVATSARMARAVTVDVEQRGVVAVPYNGAMLGVSSVDIRDGAGVRLHVYLHNTGDQPLAIPAPTGAIFALIDARGRSLNAIGALSAETSGGHRAPDVANGTLTLPALERVSYVLLFGPAAPDATELMLRVTGAGVVRGLPAHADAGMQAGAMPNAQPNAQQLPQQPPQQPAGMPSASGSGSPP